MGVTNITIAAREQIVRLAQLLKFAPRESNEGGFPLIASLRGF